jgi:SAM-dependent methyltransferase
MAEHEPHGHHHGQVRLDEGDWEALAAHTELEGELLLDFVTQTAQWMTEVRGPHAPSVRRVLDVGSGPGVSTCELARLFPDADVIAVDGSPAMLERTTRRADGHGLDGRITTHLAELPNGLDDIEPADVIWASMSLHHIGDETNALRLLRGLVRPFGLVAIAEIAEPMRVLPDDLDVARPGLVDRLERAESDWFAAMRAGLSGSVPSTDLESMLTSAGFDVVGSRTVRMRIDPPLSDAARQVIVDRIDRARSHLADRLDAHDLDTLDVLADSDDPRSVRHRADVFIASSRQIVVARPRHHP